MPKVHECPNCDANLRPYQEMCSHCGSYLDWSDVPRTPKTSKVEIEDDVFAKPTTFRIRTDVLTRTGYELETEDEEETDFVESRSYESRHVRTRTEGASTGKYYALLVLIMLLISMGVMSGVLDFQRVTIEADYEPEIVGFTISAQVDLWVERFSGFDTVLYGFPEQHITNTGIDYIRSLLQVGLNDSITPFKYLRIGMGTQTDEGLTRVDAGLADEFSRGEATTEKIQFNEYKLQMTFSTGSFDGQTISEMGVFNQRTDGIMLLYQSFIGITLYSADSLRFDITITIGE